MTEESASTEDSPEEGESTKAEVSDHVRLPVGIEIAGVRYRDVIIDEMGGQDEKLAGDKKKTGGNGAKGMTLVLCRSIQAIAGLVEQKKNPNSLIDRKYVRGMYQVDRDFLVSRIQMLADKDETRMQAQCICKTIYEEDVLLSELKVREHPDDAPCELSFTLPRGYLEVVKRGDNVLHREGILRFPIGSDQEAVSPIAKNNQGLGMTAMLAATITKLGTLENIDQDVTGNMKSRDRRYLFNQIRDDMPGLVQWKPVECYECGRDLEAVVDLSGFFG